LQECEYGATSVEQSRTESMTVTSSPAGRTGTGKRAPLENELSQLLQRVKNARDRTLVARHLGWDGRPPCSLRQAGAGFHLTRERARQVFAEALPLLQADGATPSLDAVLAFVRKRRFELVTEVERQLQQKGLTSGPFSLQGVLTAAHVLGRAPGFDLEQFGAVWFVGQVSEVGRTILLTAAKQVEHYGATRVSVVVREVSKKSRRQLDRALVRRVLQTRPDIRWLDKSSDWFWLMGPPRNRLRTRVQKVLAATPQLSVSTLREAISRDYVPLQLPESVLRSFCESLSWCHVNGPNVTASSTPSVGQVVSGGEAITCAILREHGGVMELSELQKQCYEAGVKRANLWRVLSFSPLIRRLDRELYGFIGAADPGR